MSFFSFFQKNKTRTDPRPTFPVPRPATPSETASYRTSVIQVPVAMILQAMETPALAAPLADLEKTALWSQTVAIPLPMLLPQLPSGKIEISMEYLIPRIPAGLLASGGYMTAYRTSYIELPLMEVIMLIPPEMLALRPE